jgi:bifunctional DNA-binding transcriptional regulator/antitoxin component of YhaV-PrlF toxin-antitoxin module
MTETVAMFQLDAKGRTVLPASVRHAAGFRAGEPLVARVLEPGSVTIESREAVRDRVWAAAPSRPSVDATADVRDLREEDNAIADAAAARRSDLRTSPTAGADLLRALGL